MDSVMDADRGGFLLLFSRDSFSSFLHPLRSRSRNLIQGSDHLPLGTQPFRQTLGTDAKMELPACIDVLCAWKQVHWAHWDDWVSERWK